MDIFSLINTTVALIFFKQSRSEITRATPSVSTYPKYKNKCELPRRNVYSVKRTKEKESVPMHGNYWKINLAKFTNMYIVFVLKDRCQVHLRTLVLKTNA